MIDLLQQLADAEQAIFDHVGYDQEEDALSLPITDDREYVWRCPKEHDVTVSFGASLLELLADIGECYEEELHYSAPQKVYRGELFTLIIKRDAFMILDNTKELEPK